MDKPQKLVLDGGSYFRLGCSSAPVGYGILAFVCVLALTESDATIKDLLLPVGALSVMLLLWPAICSFIGLVQRFSSRLKIDKFFDAGIWQYWRYSTVDWQNVVDAEYKEMYQEEGLGVFRGAIYSSITGLVIGTIIVLVSIFAIKDAQLVGIMISTAGVIFFLCLGIGLFQPLQTRFKAQLFRRRAQGILEPRVWFGSEGVYHEFFGYTSLEDLSKVTHHRKRKKAIKFTIKYDTHTYRLEIPVPSGYEQQAKDLVRRYRQERLRD
jgi:hypothetical protein